MSVSCSAYLFLFHQLGIGTIIDNIRSKDRRRQFAIYLLSIHILQLSIENELITICPKTDSNLLA